MIAVQLECFPSRSPPSCYRRRNPLARCFLDPLESQFHRMGKMYSPLSSQSRHPSRKRLHHQRALNRHPFPLSPLLRVHCILYFTLTKKQRIVEVVEHPSTSYYHCRSSCLARYFVHTYILGNDTPHPVQPRCRYGVLACTREGHSAPSTSKAFAPDTLMHAVPLGHKHGSYYPFAALALSSNPNSSHPPRSSSQSGCTLVYSVRSLCTIRGWDLD